ncbi:hypothetical protein B0H10DRAFT_2035897, partial [Mycena sp. CBHHK59/15]
TKRKSDHASGLFELTVLHLAGTLQTGLILATVSQLSAAQLASLRGSLSQAGRLLLGVNGYSNSYRQVFGWKILGTHHRLKGQFPPWYRLWTGVSRVDTGCQSNMRTTNVTAFPSLVGRGFAYGGRPMQAYMYAYTMSAGSAYKAVERSVLRPACFRSIVEVL